MLIKLLGASAILFVCTAFGFRFAASYRAEVQCLRSMIASLDYMSSELQYHLTPLPQLMQFTSGNCSNKLLKGLFQQFGYSLEDKYFSDAEKCAESLSAVLCDLPQSVSDVFIELCKTMGRFDMDGQLKAIQFARDECKNKLDILSEDLHQKLRSYRTLGICAGVAMVIIFI